MNRRIVDFGNCYVVLETEEQNKDKQFKQLKSELTDLEDELYNEFDFKRIEFLECLIEDAKQRIALFLTTNNGNASLLGSIGILPSAVVGYADEEIKEIPFLNEAHRNIDEILKVHKRLVARASKNKKYQYSKWILQNVVREIEPVSPTAGCLRNPQKFRSDGTNKVAVLKRHKSVWYDGLQTCKNHWKCPCCSEKNGIERREEVTAYSTACRRCGGSVVFATLTFSHNRFDDLNVLMEKMKTVESNLSSQRAYKKLQRDYLVDGTIRNLEVKLGFNGWHPHLHVLYFLGCELSKDRIDSFKAELHNIWANECKKVGLKTDKTHGVDIRNGDFVNQYITKWSLANEVTGWMSKVGDKSISPMDLLRMIKALSDFPNNEDLVNMVKQLKALWKEYIQAFKGRKQLNVSPSLKKRYKELAEAIQEERKERQEREDQEEAEKEGCDNKVVCLKSFDDPEEWRLIVYADLRSWILEIAKQVDDPEEFNKYYREAIKIARKYKDDGNDRALEPIIHIEPMKQL